MSNSEYGYLLVDVNWTKKRIVRYASQVNRLALLRNLNLNNISYIEVSKPPSSRTIRRWKRCGYARAICGCKIREARGGRCEKHGKMSWITAFYTLTQVDRRP